MTEWIPAIVAFIAGPALALITHWLTRDTRKGSLGKMQEEIRQSLWKQVQEYLAILKKELDEERTQRRRLEEQVKELLRERETLKAENQQLRDRVAVLELHMATRPLDHGDQSHEPT